MATVTIGFADGFSREDVLNKLTADESGIQIDVRQPLDSGLEIGLAIAGVVLSAAQLAVALWELKSNAVARCSGESANAAISIRETGGEMKMLSATSVEELEAELKRRIDRDRDAE